MEMRLCPLRNMSNPRRLMPPTIAASASWGRAHLCSCFLSLPFDLPGWLHARKPAGRRSGSSGAMQLWSLHRGPGACRQPRSGRTAAFWVPKIERIVADDPKNAELAMSAALVLDAPGTGFVARYLVKPNAGNPLHIGPQVDYDAVERAVSQFESKCRTPCLAMAAKATILQPKDVRWWRLRALLLFQCQLLALHSRAAQTLTGSTFWRSAASTTPTTPFTTISPCGSSGGQASTGPSLNFPSSTGEIRRRNGLFPPGPKEAILCRGL